MPSILSIILSVTSLMRQSSAQNSSDSYSTPYCLRNGSVRHSEIAIKQAGYLYGPSLMGNTSYFPTGSLGDAMVERDITQWTADYTIMSNLTTEDAKVASKALAPRLVFQNLSDFSQLYKDKWTKSVPDGVWPGVISNYTSDLLFSMERLSINPYTIRRLDKVDVLPFVMDDSIVKSITSYTLQELLWSGSLFFADYRIQSKYEMTERYTAYTDAYFYICPLTNDFLPLAIRTNVGSDLIYTPADSEMDWLLAKMMFEVNDVFSADTYHLVNQHVVAEAVHQAALRTLSDQHPVMQLLNRLMYQEYAIRPAGAKVLLSEGGVFDLNFAISGKGTSDYVTDIYEKRLGSFESSYFLDDLTRRGLINSTQGPSLKTFPFFEDGSIIYTSIRRFMAAFVSSYYNGYMSITDDCELQSWCDEAITKAHVHQFVSSFDTQDSLINALTHIAFLSGFAHHILNTGELSHVSGILPLHPVALYAPLPTTKNITDIMPFLPNVTQALAGMDVWSQFNRPTFKDTNKTLIHMFDDAEFLKRTNEMTRAAERLFQAEMTAFSESIRSRTFDDEGLCQGMPFVWKAADPGSIPFYFAV